jgi:hypothetical protein
MLGHLIVSQHFMEPEGSSPHSQELSTCSYPEPDQSSPHHPIPPSKIHPNIIHPPMSYYTWRRVQITKLLVMQFSPFSTIRMFTVQKRAVRLKQL